ncbi:hypothetical protein C8R45DRAFT_499833 [Mycena sanguinolenta]|nr:hypothetical protein C8R45DRAFT_499833 [Mycena sanguinolenta]
MFMEFFRHPNIIQLYGSAGTKGLRAIVFHDELIPYSQFFRRFQHSPILSTYILGYCNAEFREAINYLSRVCRDAGHILVAYEDLPLWIRPATDELCLDVVQDRLEPDFSLAWWKADIPHLESVSLRDPNAEAMVISSLDEDLYYDLCFVPPIAQFRVFTLSTQLPIHQGPAILRLDSNQRTMFRITETPDLGRELR